MVEKLTALKALLPPVVEACKTKKENMAEAVTTLADDGEVDQVATDLKSAVKDLAEQKCVKDLKAGLKTARAWLNSLMKEKRKKAQAGTRASATKKQLHEQPTPEQVPELVRQVQVELKKEAIKDCQCSPNMTNLAKGSCVVIPVVRLRGAVAEVVTKMPYYKNQKDWVYKHISTNEQSTGSAAIMRDAVERQVNHILTENFDKAVHSKLPCGTDEGWLDDVFKKQFFLSTPSHSKVSLTPFCLPEVRLILEGELFIAAMPLECLQGTSAADKLDGMLQMRVDVWLQTLAECGMCTRMLPGAAVILPAGYCIFEVVVAQSDDADACASGLRWSFISEDAAQHAFVASQLGDALASWPSMESSDWSKLRRRLQQ